MTNLSPFERFHTFMRGWRAGSGTLSFDPKFTEHLNAEVRALYDEGYKRGLEDRRRLQTELCARFDYKPNILRAQKA